MWMRCDRLLGSVRLELSPRCRATSGATLRDAPPAALPRMTIDDLVARARGGDAKALRALLATARYLGLGLGSVVNAIDPSHVYIGGEITAAWDLIEATVRAALAERALTPPAGATPITVVPPEQYPRLRGAAALIAAPSFAKGWSHEDDVAERFARTRASSAVFAIASCDRMAASTQRRKAFRRRHYEPTSTASSIVKWRHTSCRFRSAVLCPSACMVRSPPANSRGGHSFAHWPRTRIRAARAWSAAAM
jgi:hypothetical protein